MKTARITLISLVMVAMGVMTTILITPATDVSAAATCPGGSARLLTFPAWYNGLVDNNCQIEPIGGTIGKPLKDVVIIILLNLVEIVLQLVAYAAVVFIIKGGFDYMLSNGDAGKITNAKNTIERAVFGLIIALASVAIVSLVASAV